ncbi:MAG: 50S ribosomal protein L5 [Ignavibacteria bacterium CG_4_8_14_3_um_filter_37_9]|nr:50S ribosomal protein L5 [Ignavibacteria bacterium]PIP79311.1 MAG: 50S ribosomal protein L5 [Ignavibacteria bacterium CG22_combo_CG10-13_8_21_14_all_37_15]PIS44741.1 MAG: 50S ribosomal protein L5 [Ignavibacteria bacterium CG08_land_8_20_14_0_20_37_9]PIW98312.1 MAG: 50S ribosomal protein L5 [Ignavibacteria bacterium CG_4_8_14_3_um_filter_37_9]PIX95457.1 MAG: 50S ribosomal protein L5 [Ignavibacteria bacterium CG_4_10_14_3_um_filter_37_18]PJC59394.1 MAG: 50S ribosomal protein L5 [Ignavibacteri
MAEKKVKQSVPGGTNEKKGKQPKEAPKEHAANASEVRVPNRLLGIYRKQIVSDLAKKLNYKNVMQVPKLTKIVVNMGVGAAASDAKVMEEAIRDLETIVGQKASVRKAKKDISNFKLRKGVNIGVMVTLRKERMYEFLDRFINVALPRVRDFKGLSDKSFDGRGNYSIGVKEQIIFPEINADKVLKVLGMDVTFVTTANTDAEAFELLKAFGFPFRKKEIN